jgi:O-antigen ligase
MPENHYQDPSKRAAIRLLTGAVLFTSGFVDMTGQVRFGSFSGQAVLTVAYFVAGCFLYLLIRGPGRGVSKRLLPLTVFALLAGTSLAWTTSPSNGIQNVVAISTFVLMLHIGGTAASADPGFRLWINRRLSWMIAVGVSAYAVSLLIFGPGNDSIIGARSFGMFALFAVSQQLAKWRYAGRLSFIGAIIITALIGASESRLALGVAIVLFPLAQMPTWRFTRTLRMAAVLLIALGLSYGGLLYFDSLRERFSSGDVSLRIGTFVINGSGRSAFWRVTSESIDSAVVLGHGAGSAEGLIEALYVTIRHPHSDYLRIFHDYGALGLTFWSGGMGIVLVWLWKNWKSWDVRSPRIARLHLNALLSTIAFALMMIADNPVVYLFMVAPLGLIVGASLKTDEVRAAPTRPRRKAAPVLSCAVLP